MSKLYQVTGSQGLQFHLGNHPEFLGLFKTLKSSMENVALLRVASDHSSAPQSHRQFRSRALPPQASLSMSDTFQKSNTILTENVSNQETSTSLLNYLNKH